MSDEPQERPGGKHGHEPSPEDVFAGRPPGPASTPEPPINVYLTDIASDAPANVLKGIREGLRLLRRAETRVPLADAEAVYTRFVEGERPCFMGNAEDGDHAREVAHSMVEASNDRLAVGIGLDDADVQQIAAEHEAAQHDPEDDEGDPEVANKPLGPMSPLTPPTLIPRGESASEIPSLSACKMAIALMAQHDGNGTLALIWARVLAETTGDADWTGAARLILASLPLRDPSS